MPTFVGLFYAKVFFFIIVGNKKYFKDNKNTIITGNFQIVTLCCIII